MNDQELNEAVARKLGWRWSDKHDPLCYWFMPNGKCPPGGEVPAYSTSIEAAWEIVERWPRYFMIYRDEYKKWRVGIGTEQDFEELAIANTAPLAICRAFLKLP